MIKKNTVKCIFVQAQCNFMLSNDHVQDLLLRDDRDYEASTKLQGHEAHLQDIYYRELDYFLPDYNPI